MPGLPPRSRGWCRVLILLLLPCVVSCGGDGTGPVAAQIRLVVTTTGDDIDSDGYNWSLDDGRLGAIGPNASLLIDDVEPGTRALSFANISGNCQADPASPLVVTLAAGETLEIELDVSCAARLNILATASGANTDVAFLVAIDVGPWQLLLPDVRLDLPGVPAGSYEVRIAGIAPNCAVAGGDRRTITVPAHDIASVQFAIECTATTRRILFGSTRDGGYDLYVMDADGTNVVRLTDGSRPALHGRWSPDGSRIAYHSPEGDTGFDIHVMNADGSGSSALTTDGSGGAANLFPDWSPDGSQILFEKDGQVWVMEADGANARRLREPGYRPRWSPDGSRIAFYDGTAIWVMGADGSGAVIIQQVANYYSAYPVWSPDGSRILFASPRDGAFTDIYVMNADGSGVVRLTNSPAGILNEDFDWAPDGSRIVFRTNRDAGNPEIYVMNADGSNPTRIANIWDEYGPAWHP